MQALRCRRLYSAAGRGVRHDRPGAVVWGRVGRVLGVGLVLLGLVGCGLPGGGKQQPDWTGLAERLITEAGTDQIVGVSVDVSGQLDLTFRVAGGYTSWSYTGEGEPRQYNESADRTRWISPATGKAWRAVARGPHPARREEPRLKLCAVAASLPMTGQQAEQQPEPHSGADQRADAHRPAGRQTDQNGDRDRHGNQQQGDAEQPP